MADPVTYQTAEPDIFVGGDVYTGPKFAIDAIAAGKQGAISIHRYVQPHSSLTIGRDPNYYKELDKDDILVENYDNTGRQHPGMKPGADKKSFRDYKLTFTEENKRFKVNNINKIFLTTTGETPRNNTYEDEEENETEDSKTIDSNQEVEGSNTDTSSEETNKTKISESTEKTDSTVDSETQESNVEGD